MKRIGMRAKFLVAVILFFVVCLGFFLSDYIKYSQIWLVHPANKDLYQDGLLIRPGRILSADGTTLYSLDGNGRFYAENLTLRKATLHAVGDLQDTIGTGVIKTKKPKLLGYDLLSGVYDAFEGGNEITLTMDAKTCRTAYEAMGDYNGTVGVYNYQTGEILCMVSKPSFDPLNVPDLTTAAYEGVYVNRLVSGLYVPGSVFKLITTMAALETVDGIEGQKFICDGGIEMDGEWIACTKNHGTIDFETALAVSCNAAYAEIATQVGSEVLTRYAKAAGLDRRFSIDGVLTPKGRFDLTDARQTDLAWAGIGQYTDMVNPMQYMIYMGAIAQNGKAVTPFYVKDIKTSYGFPQSFKLPWPGSEARMLSEETAEQLKALMRNNAKTAYGDDRFAGMELCAKTGTAELDEGDPHSWFVGFLDNPDTPLAFVVVLEHGGLSSNTAIPVARTVLNTAVQTFE